MIARLIYNLCLWLCAPFVVARLLWRSKRTPAYRQRLLERFGLSKLALNQCIWVHAVSVGETMAAAPLIEQLKNHFPQQDILVTTTTPTGSDCVKRSFGGTVHHVYMPYDLPPVVQYFLQRMRPTLIIIMETEVWPNLIAQAQLRQIPLLLANARLSERSLGRYQCLGGFSRHVFKQISLICAQSAADARRFLSLGVNRDQVVSIGSLKFDLELPHNLDETSKALRVEWGKQRLVWIAASTHEGEETLMLDVYEQLLPVYPSLLLVLVPRHPERFDRVAQLIEQRGIRFLRRSLMGTDTAGTQVILGDTMGELFTLFKASDFALMGGSFVPVGGHNMLEPMACGLATIVGPHMFNFQSITQMLLEEKSLIQARNQDQLKEEVSRLCRNTPLRQQLGARGAQMVQDNRGALENLMKQIERLHE